jgi:predicted nucleotidyltransferase component of viral defense system
MVEMARDPLLSSTLSLYGGTAINLVHIRPIPRLSEDLDFNYRHMGDRDWGDVRDDVDVAIKEVLDGLGYMRDDIRIQPRYNIGRFHVNYRSTEGIRDSFKIEIGYTRRIPDTTSDAMLPFEHPISGETEKVLTPVAEELFANKWCTMVARAGKVGYPRDAFDVSSLSREKYDRSLFLDLVMVEGLLSEIELEEATVAPLDTTMVSRLNTMLGPRPLDHDGIAREVAAFTEDVVAEVMERGWSELKGDFDAYGIVRLDLLSNKGRIHPDLEEHPLLLWILEKRKRGKLSRTGQHDPRK